MKWQSFPESIDGDHDKGFWVLSKHADVQAASHNPELFSALDGPQLSHQPGIAGTMLVSMDGRDHHRQRRLISAGFTPRMVGQLEDQIRQWAESIVDRALERGECDFVSEIAYKLPMNVIADIVGIPVKDRDALVLVGERHAARRPAERTSRRRSTRDQIEMFEYAQKLGQEKRANPQDDVWTILSTVEVETDDGERMASARSSWTCSFSCSSSLEARPPECTLPRASGAARPPRPARASTPDARRNPLAVEEILRWSSPVSCFAGGRPGNPDTGVPIAEGDACTMWYPLPTAIRKSSLTRSAST